MTLDELRQQTVTDEHGTVRFAAPYGQMAVSLVEAEFLYALVRLTRPERVLELGTGLGVSGRFIAEALAENEHGFLTTIEPNRSHWPDAHGLLIGQPVSISMTTEGLDLDPDLVFIDSGYEHRPGDIDYWVTQPAGPLIVVHDANRGYPALDYGRGTLLPGSDGFWIGRAG